MKIFITCLMIFLSFSFTYTASAQRVVRKGVTQVGEVAKAPTKFILSINELNGKWQEYARKTGDAKANLDFTDSLCLNINNGSGSSGTKIDNSLTMFGEAKIENTDQLYIANDIFTILKNGSGILTLQDERGIHFLKKIDMFYLETVGKDSVKMEKNNTALTNINSKNLYGKWNIYKRVAKPGYITPQTTIIKWLNITEAEVLNNFMADIAAYKGNEAFMVNKAKVTFVNGKLNIKTEAEFYSYNIYKASETEFIFGEENGMMYYASK